MGAKVETTGRRRDIDHGATFVSGYHPLCLDPALALQPVQLLVQIGVVDAERAAGALGNPPRDAISVHRLPRERLQDEDVERSLQQVERRSGHCSPLTW